NEPWSLTCKLIAENPRIASHEQVLLTRRWRWYLIPRLGVAQQSISSPSPSAARTRHRRSGYKKRGLIRKSAGRRADRPIYWAASVAGELVGGRVDLVLGLLSALLQARRALVRLTFGLEGLVTGCRAAGLPGASAQLLGRGR